MALKNEVHSRNLNRRKRRDALSQKLPPDGKLQRLENFAGSQIGKYLFQFIFVILVGSSLAFSLDYYRDKLDRETKINEVETQAFSEIQDYTSKTLSGRLSTQEFLVDAISNKANGDDLLRRSENYENFATEAESLAFSFKEKMRTIRPDGEAYTEDREFSFYLNNHISRSFRRIDKCISAARQKVGERVNLSDQSSVPYVSRHDAGSLVCGKKRDASGKPQFWTTESEFDDLRICLGAFRAELSGRVTLLRGKKTGGIMPFPRPQSGCDETDWDCQLRANWEQIPEKLKEGCVKLADKPYIEPRATTYRPSPEATPEISRTEPDQAAVD